MNGSVWLWAAAGAGAGALQALSLWRTSRRPASIEGGIGVLRVFAVGAVLFLAAKSGGLLPAAMGWGLGLPSAGCALFLRDGR